MKKLVNYDIIDKTGLQDEQGHELFFFGPECQAIGRHYVEHDRVSNCLVCKHGDSLLKLSTEANLLAKVSPMTTAIKSKINKLSIEFENLVEEAFKVLQQKGRK